MDASLVVVCLGAVVCAFHHDWTSLLTLTALAGAFCFVVAGELQRLYVSWRLRSMDEEFRCVLLAWGAACSVLVVGAFLLELSSAYSRPAILVWFFVTPAVVILARLAVRAALAWLRAGGANTSSVAVAGSCQLAQDIVRRLERSAGYGLRLSIYEDRSPERVNADECGPVQRTGNLDALVEKARRGEIDYIFIALPLRAEERIVALVNRLADTTASVYVIPDLFVFDLMRARLTMLGEMPAVSVYESPFDGLNGWLKRAEDLLLGLLLLAAAALPMAAIALAIRLSTRGPALFRQRRYGLNGRMVQVLKFRTMTAAEDGASVAQASRSDARVTPFGRILRATSLDELPQLFNVLSGQMSLVGPRPHAVAHNEAYRGLIHGYMLRHKVKPGITGWAQVNGWRGETDTLDKMKHRVEHDLAYMRNWSLALDLRILVATVLVVLSRKNAY
jgi:putative colanic acid biosynthesis UDP-glucose lipid carrier transferase